MSVRTGHSILDPKLMCPETLAMKNIRCGNVHSVFSSFDFFVYFEFYTNFCSSRKSRNLRARASKITATLKSFTTLKTYHFRTRFGVKVNKYIIFQMLEFDDQADKTSCVSPCRNLLFSAPSKNLPNMQKLTTNIPLLVQIAI